MITSDIVSRVRSTFGDSTGIQVTDQDIFNWINDGQRDIAYESKLLQSRAKALVSKGQFDYTLPDDYLTVFSLSYMGLVLTALTMQEKDNFIGNADNLATQSIQGRPNSFWIWAQTLTLYPTPDTSDVEPNRSLVIYYTRTPTKITTSSDTFDIPVAYHNTLLDRVLQRAYEKDENWQAAQIKEGQYATGVAKLVDNAAFSEQEFYPSISTSVRDAGDGSFGGDTQSGSIYY